MAAENRLKPLSAKVPSSLRDRVTLDKLSRQLRRDLGANPKKGAILGVMLLVAAYFWAPLIFGKRGEETPEPAAGQQTQSKENPLVVPQQKQVAKHAVGWDQLRQAIASDPLMRPAAITPKPHDPFVLPTPAPPEPTLETDGADEMIAEAEPAAPAAPAEVAITIASVLIGPRGRAVVVDGEVYRLGDTIPAGDEPSSDAGYRLTKIEPTSVEIEVGGVRRSLDVARPRLAKGDRIRRAANRAAP